MSKLTAKQEKFCIEYVKTGNASEAYRLAYDAGGMKPASINRKAKELMDNGKIAAMLVTLRAPAIKEAQVTLIDHLSDLKDLRAKAEKDGKWGPAIAAEIARGKASGLYVEHVKLDATVKGTVSYRANMPART